jgi:hypothetical protein
MSNHELAGVRRPEGKFGTRRALLGAGVGALGAVVANAVGRPGRVLAGTDGDVVKGSGVQQYVTDATWLQNISNNKDVFIGEAGSNGTGIIGRSYSGSGVHGDSSQGAGIDGHSYSGTGVRGIGVAGVWGSGDTSGVEGGTGQQTGLGVWGHNDALSGSTVGVLGESHSSDGSGVKGTGLNGGTGVSGDGRVGVFATSSTDGWMGIWGRHFGAGFGVAGDSVSHIGVSGTSDATTQPAMLGRSRGHSTGVFGFSGGTGDVVPAASADTGIYGAVASKGGYAIRGSGRVRFDKVSGVATIAAGATSVTVSPGVDVTTDSFVLLTPKANVAGRSLWFSTDATNDRITISMSASRTSPTKIAWLLLS